MANTKQLAAFAKSKDGPEDDDEDTNPGEDSDDEEALAEALEDADPMDGDPEEMAKLFKLALASMTDAQIASMAGQLVDDGGGDENIAKLMDGYDPGISNTPPAWVGDGGLWKRVVLAVDPMGQGSDSFDEPYTVAGNMYHLLGGKFRPFNGAAALDVDADEAGDAARD